MKLSLTETAILADQWLFRKFFQPFSDLTQKMSGITCFGLAEFAGGAAFLVSITATIASIMQQLPLILNIGSMVMVPMTLMFFIHAGVMRRKMAAVRNHPNPLGKRSRDRFLVCALYALPVMIIATRLHFAIAKMKGEELWPTWKQYMPTTLLMVTLICMYCSASFTSCTPKINQTRNPKNP